MTPSERWAAALDSLDDLERAEVERRYRDCQRDTSSPRPGWPVPFGELSEGAQAAWFDHVERRRRAVAAVDSAGTVR